MRTLSYAAALTATLILSAAANATVLPPGSGEQPPDVFAGCPGCTLLGTSGGPGFVVTANINGSVLTMNFVSAVYSDPSNPFGAGKLDFMYQFTNESSSTTGVAHVAEFAFAPIRGGLETDVGYTATGATLPGGVFVNGNVAPGLVDRTTDNAFEFDFAVGPVDPGKASTVLIIQTNTRNTGLGQFNVDPVNGIGFGILGIPAPLGLPEPATLALFGFGLIGIALSRRRLAR